MKKILTLTTLFILTLCMTSCSTDNSSLSDSKNEITKVSSESIGLEETITTEETTTTEIKTKTVTTTTEKKITNTEAETTTTTETTKLTTEPTSFETTKSTKDKPNTTIETTTPEITTTTTTIIYETVESNFVLNTETMKAHTTTCGDVAKMNIENRWDYYGTIEDLQNMGYSPCGHCRPW